MIYEIDCPFDFGDNVYVKDKEPEYVEIECPFCHGNPVYDTGIMIEKDEIRSSRKEDNMERWFVKCTTCNGTGVVRARKETKTVYKKAKVIEITRFNFNNWMDSEFAVELEKGHNKYVKGSRIYTEEQYKALAKESVSQ